MADTEIIKELEKALKVAEETINRQKKLIEKSERVERFADKTIATLQAEIKKLNGQVEHLIGYVKTLKAEKDDLKIELQAMRNAANGYKAEVERLKEKDETRHKVFMTKCEELETAKAEAVKEFVGEFERSLINMPQKDINYSNLVEHIDNLAKEKVGDAK